MLEYYRENLHLYLLFTLWIVVGALGGPVILGLLPITMFLMRKKGMYEELLIGYLFILVLSDSQEALLGFAKNVKSVYLPVLALFLIFDKENFQPLNKLYKIFIPFFAISIFTMSFSVGDAFFFTSIQKTFSFFLSFIVIPNYVTKLYLENGKAFFRRVIFFSFSVLLCGFLLKYISPDEAFLLGGRFRGLFGGPNGLGMFCVLFFIIFFVFNDFFPDLFSKNEKRIIFGAVLFSVYLTGSRNTVISLLIFFLFQRFFSLSPFLGFIIFIITLFIADFINTNATTIILSLGLGEYFRTNTLDEGSGRYIAWAFAWKQIQHNFFIGKGFAYNEFYMRQHYGFLSKLGHQGGIHNSFLTFWMDQGLIGLLIYLRSYILVFIKGSQKTKLAFPIMFAITFTAIFE
nr:O-antigen ligase family protein [Nitrosopumilus sp.]